MEDFNQSVNKSLLGENNSIIPGSIKQKTKQSNKRKKVVIVLLVFAVVLGVSLAVYFLFYSSSDWIKPIKEGNVCYTKVEKIVRGDSMQPLIRNGANLILLKGYYNCHSIKRGDVVAYRLSAKKAPLIKRVLVLPQDRLGWRDNSLLVNGKILTNSQHKVYRFNSREKKMISLYIENGCLTSQGYLIFGDKIKNSFDSRRFGAVSKNNIIGKFALN